MVHEVIENIRASKGITKTFMAKKLGLSLQGYIHIANGSVRLDVERLKTIAEILDVKPAIFFEQELTDYVNNDSL